MGSGKSKIAQKYVGADMFLYWLSGSPACFRAMIALEEKKLSGYMQKHLNYLEMEHKSAEVIRLNPRGQVPTFTHKGHVINESMGICEYLQYMFPDRGNTLVAEDKESYRLMLQRKFEATNLQKKCEEVVYYLKSKKEDEIDLEDLKRRKRELFAELQIWEGYVKQLGENCFLAGKYNFTLADLAFYPYLAFCVHFGLSLDSRLPGLAAYYARATKREAVQKAWPAYWKLPVQPNDMYFVDV